MKTPLSRLLFAFLLLLPITAGARAQNSTSGTTVTLTLLHTNDLHGHLLPFAYTEVGRSLKEQERVGGAAQRATLIRRLRGEIENPVLVVDSGDTFTRGPLTIPYLGIADTEAMNAIGYDLAAIGNNEFKAKDATEATDAAGSQAALLAIVKRSRFPWICANCTDARGAILEGVQPFVVRQVGRLRVGFLGLTSGRVATYPQAKGWTITDPIVAAKTYIPLARAQCDVLIAVTHIGVDQDKKLAAQTSGIDAIVGGDSHTFLYKPLSIKNADGSADVPIVQDGEFGVNLGRLDLTFTRHEPDGAWHLTTALGGLLPVGPDLAAAPDVSEAIVPFTGPLLRFAGALPANVIGKTPGDRMRQTTQFVVDALRRGTGADYALNPSGSGFFSSLHEPGVRLYDIYAIMPFKDHAVIVRRTGVQLKALIASNPDNVVSGPDPMNIEPDATYKVALIDFNAATDYKIPAADQQDTGRNVTDLMIDFLAPRQ